MGGIASLDGAWRGHIVPHAWADRPSLPRASRVLPLVDKANATAAVALASALKDRPNMAMPFDAPDIRGA
jgi:hypothetical protein